MKKSAVPVKVPNTASKPIPAVLMPYQGAWSVDPAPLKVIEKSRRTGITWAEAADDVLIAASSSEAGGQNVYYIAYNQDMTIEYIQACAMFARLFNYAAAEIEEGFWDGEEEDKHIKTYTIRFPASGFRIVALSSRPSNLRGRQGVIVIDEAAFHEKLDELLKAALAMLIWGGKVRVISTHNGADNPFNTLIEDIRSGKRAGVVHRITFQEAVADGLYERVCLRLGKDWNVDEQAAWVKSVYAFYGEGAAEELDCVPARGGGVYLPLALIEARMAKPDAIDAPVIVRKRWPDEFGLLPVPIREAEVDAWLKDELQSTLAALDKTRRHGFGMDFARVGDLSVLTVLEQTKNLIDRVKVVVEIGNWPFAQQRQLVSFVGLNLPNFYAASMDATGNGAELAEYAADTLGRLRIEQVKLTDNFYLEKMPRFKAAMEDATLENLPRDDECRDDLRAIRRIDGVPKIGKEKTQRAGGGKQQRHGDFAIALFLAHAAMHRDVAPIEYTPLPRNTGAWREMDAEDRSRDRISRDLPESVFSKGGGW
ncbi:MAG: hypothetical protein C4516_04185 [Oxalobacter sp.]|nr:MAG: hypothetical protein C4516_04185 [Oxalobacter sp.]